MAEGTKCPNCGHLRTQHGREGCTHGDKQYGQCPCKTTYMDLSPRRK